MNYEETIASEVALNNIKAGIDVEVNAQILEEFLTPIIHSAKEKERKRLRNVDAHFQEFNTIAEMSKIIVALTNGKALYNAACDQLRFRESETQDLLHVLELTDEPDEMLIERAKDLAEVRRDRRLAKDFIELTKPLYEFVEKNPKVISDLKKIQGEISKKDNAMKGRVYTPRQRTALEVAFERANGGTSE